MGGFQWCGGMKLADILQLLQLKLNVMERCNQSNKKQRDISHLISLKNLIEKYGKTAPDLSSWLENELPEGFTVFNVEPDSLNARRKLRTTNMVEFQNKELKKRTRCIRVFPNKESLLRIATALLIELDEKWLADGKVYLKG